MTTTTKKGAKKSKTKPRLRAAKKSQRKKSSSNQKLQRELADALARENATGDVLRMIAQGPGDLRSLLDAIAERAARLCDSIDAQIVRLYDDGQGVVASYGSISVNPRQKHVPLDRGTVAGRSMVDRQTIHVHDILNAPVSEYPRARKLARRHGYRTALATPLLRQGVSVGAILIRRREARPFSDRQINLLETFADQAVIAMENARLFEELQTSNLRLAESLEQQTATAEILGVIASSSADLKPVLDVVAESAARLCDATDAVIQRVEGNYLRGVSHYGLIPGSDRPLRISREWPAGRAVVDRQTLHIADVLAVVETEFPDARLLQRAQGTRTLLVAPLIRENVSIGTILIRRTEVRPFTDKHIALLETFADQTVIAIENARLFKELNERTNELTRSNV